MLSASDNLKNATHTQRHPEFAKKKSSKVNGQETVKSDKSFDVMSELERLFRNLKAMPDVLQKQISLVYDCSKQCETFGEFETSSQKCKLSLTKLVKL